MGEVLASEAGKGTSWFKQVAAEVKPPDRSTFSQLPSFVQKCFKALKLPNQLTNNVLHLRSCMAFEYGTELNQVDAFRLRTKVGLDFIEDVGALAKADLIDSARDVEQYIRSISQPPYWGAPVSVSQLAVDGRWILNEF